MLYKLPQLALVKQNLLRHPLDLGKKSVFGVWPKNFNPLWQALAPFRLPFKSFDFYVPFQKYIPFPYPTTQGCFFRLQTHLFVFWYEFHLKKYSIALDLGTKEKLSFSETFLWIRRSQRQSIPFRSFWSLYQRASSFSWVSPSFFLLNSNSGSSCPYFSLAKSSSYWFEEILPNVRLFGWNFYSRLSSVSLNTTLSQSSFDSKALQRKSPWSSTNFWLSSPIHDYSFFISSLFSVKTVVLPEMFFQFKKKHDFSSDFWSQLFFRFWIHSVEVSKFSSSQFSLFFFKNLDFLNFYFVLRWFLKLSLSFSPIFPRTHRRLFLGRPSSSVLYRSLSLPMISQQISRPLSKASWNSLSIFPNQMLYLRYLRRHFCFSPLFVNYSLRLEERILDLNFFLTFFFQSHSLNCSIQFYQRVFLWFFFLWESSRGLPTAARFATLTPNSKVEDSTTWVKRNSRKRK